MKRTIFLLALASSVLIPNARAQSLKWACTNALPEALTNGSSALVLSSLNDDAGGSAWLYQEEHLFDSPPLAGLPLRRLIWLNKSGRLILTNDITIGEISRDVWLVRLTRTELTVQITGYYVDVDVVQTTNILRRFILTRDGTTQKDTPLEPNERVNGNAQPFEVNDRTGFFTWTSRLPAVPEFVIRRYGR